MNFVLLGYATQTGSPEVLWLDFWEQVLNVGGRFELLLLHRSALVFDSSVALVDSLLVLSQEFRLVILFKWTNDSWLHSDHGSRWFGLRWLECHNIFRHFVLLSWKHYFFRPQAVAQISWSRRRRTRSYLLVWVLKLYLVEFLVSLRNQCRTQTRNNWRARFVTAKLWVGLWLRRSLRLEGVFNHLSLLFCLLLSLQTGLLYEFAHSLGYDRRHFALFDDVG